LSTQRPHRAGRSGSSRGPRAHAPAADVEPLHLTETPPEIETFRHWQLEPHVQAVIDGMGISVPTPIQCLAIGPVLEGRDVIAKAETGTGKTLAFGAPMMSKIDPARASVLGLVLTPTRELAEQVGNVLRQLGEPRGIKVALIVGGEPMDGQIRALKSGAQVVVGTPGRVLDLYKQRFLSFPWTEFAVLDEADEMLEIGFLDDVEMILSFIPEERQTLLFSATFPPALLKLARKHTKNPAEVATAIGLKTVDSIQQSWMSLAEDDKPLALIRLIERSAEKDVLLIFCGRREDVDRLYRRLERLPFSIKALHGGYDQAARFRVMGAFRTGEVKALVATDVASRGLDVSHVTHVINYDVPRDITGYTHRIGRTGRAGRSGLAITLVSARDDRRWFPIQKQATWKIEEVPPPGPNRFGRGGPPPRAEPRRGEAPRAAAPRAEPAREEPRAPREHTPRTHAPREHAPRSHHAPAHRPHAPAAHRPHDHAPAHRPHAPAPHMPHDQTPAHRPHAPAVHKPHAPAAHRAPAPAPHKPHDDHAPAHKPHSGGRTPAPPARRTGYTDHHKRDAE
jgi:ATP-dependent RNA helicase DeaD